MRTLQQQTSASAHGPAEHASTPSLLSRTIGRLLLASALGSVAYFGVSPQPALGFICVGNDDGAVVGDGFAGASAGGGGADDGVAVLDPNLACGREANAAGNNSANTAIGRRANASGDNSQNIAVGSDAKARGSGSSHNIAIGFNNDASTVSTGDNIAVGSFAQARGERGKNIAIGRFANARGSDAENTAIGANATATGTNASAFGSGARATHANSAAFGRGAATSRDDQQVFGTGTNTYTMTGITSAASATAQGAPTRIVTSNESGDLAARSVVELGLATSDDIGELQDKATDNMMAIQSNSAAIGSLDSRVRRNSDDIDTNREGVAVAMTLDAPYINIEQSFAVGGNWANFEDSNALGFMVAGRLTKFGDTGTFDVSGGVGFGLEQDSVGGRVGGQVAW